MCVRYFFPQEEVGLRPPKTHLIGHSLGAHTAGYAGSAVKGWNIKLGRITGKSCFSSLFSVKNFREKMLTVYRRVHRTLHFESGSAIRVDARKTSTSLRCPQTKKNLL